MDFGISFLAEANYFCWVSEKLFVIDCGTYDFDFHTAQNKTPFFDLSKIGHDICLVTNLEVAREIPATGLHFRMFLQCVFSTKGIRGPCIKKKHTGRRRPVS